LETKSDKRQIKVRQKSAKRKKSKKFENMQASCNRDFDTFLVERVKDVDKRHELSERQSQRYFNRQAYMSSRLDQEEVKWEIEHLFLSHMLFPYCKDIWDVLYRVKGEQVTPHDVRAVAGIVENTLMQGLISLNLMENKQTMVNLDQIHSICQTIAQEKGQWKREEPTPSSLPTRMQAPPTVFPSMHRGTGKRKQWASESEEDDSDQDQDRVFRKPIKTPESGRKQKLKRIQQARKEGGKSYEEAQKAKTDLIRRSLQLQQSES
jgi:hypothetical protein